MREMLLAVTLSADRGRCDGEGAGGDVDDVVRGCGTADNIVDWVGSDGRVDGGGGGVGVGEGITVERAGDGAGKGGVRAP